MAKYNSIRSSNNMIKGAIFSKSGIRLLRLFLFDTSAEIHQAEAISRSGLSRATTARLLKIFRDSDILTESKKGDLKLYSINVKNPVVRQLKILLNITDIYTSIKDLQGTGTEVFLFGSAARGEDTEESDIDLLIITGFDRSSIMKVIDTIRVNMNREVNPIIYTPIEYFQLAHTNKLFYEKFEKDKIRLL